MGALNSDRAMVRGTLDKKNINMLTKSQGLPLSSTKDGSDDKKSQRSGGILGLSGINLDFRKSKDGLKSFFQKSNNKAESGAAVVSSSIEFAQIQKRH